MRTWQPFFFFLSLDVENHQPLPSPPLTLSPLPLTLPLQPFRRSVPSHNYDSMQVTDIKGTASKALHPTKNKPCYNLRNDDIEGSIATPHTFKTTRSVDPLNPRYTLPSCKILPPPEPKFTHDSYHVSDIAGTSVS